MGVSEPRLLTTTASGPGLCLPPGEWSSTPPSIRKPSGQLISSLCTSIRWALVKGNIQIHTVPSCVMRILYFYHENQQRADNRRAEKSSLPRLFLRKRETKRHSVKRDNATASTPQGHRPHQGSLSPHNPGCMGGRAQPRVPPNLLSLVWLPDSFFSL